MEGSLLKGAQPLLEDTTFDIQYFISEHAQFLSPAQSRHLLKSLSSLQRALREQTERLASQRQTLEGLLETREKETQQKVWLWMMWSKKRCRRSTEWKPIVEMDFFSC